MSMTNNVLKNKYIINTSLVVYLGYSQWTTRGIGGGSGCEDQLGPRLGGAESRQGVPVVWWLSDLCS
jgi:hypothetical protein